MLSLGDYAASVALTALGGFDPAPMLIMAAALGAGVRRRHVVAATSLLLGGTAAWGLALTAVAGPRLLRVDWHAVIRHGALSAGVELAAGLALAGYVLWRVLTRRRRRANTATPPTRGAWGLYTTALIFVGIVVFDVPFDVHVAAAATQPWPVATAGWLAWAALSQAPVTVLVVLCLLGKQGRVARWMTRAWRSVQPYAWSVITTALALAAIFLLGDALDFVLSGHFLVG